MFTIFFAIWGGSNLPFTNKYVSRSMSDLASIINTVLYSFCWIMMVVSHLNAVLTSSGFLPKEY